MTAPFAPRNVFFCSAEKTATWDSLGVGRVDAVIIDLEDDVLPANKDSARALVPAVIDRLDPGIDIFVRSNSPRSAWFAADIAALAPLARIAALVIPKVESPGDLRTAQSLVEAATGRPLPLLAVLESPPAFIDLERIAAAPVPLAGFTMGPFDLSRALGCARDDDAPPVALARTQALMAARTFGHIAIDGPVARDLQGEARQAAFRRARAMGFDAKIVTNLDDADAVRAIFTPTAEELALAGDIAAAFAARPGAELAFLANGATVDQRNLILSNRLLAKRRTA